MEAVGDVGERSVSGPRDEPPRGGTCLGRSPEVGVDPPRSAARPGSAVFASRRVSAPCAKVKPRPIGSGPGRGHLMHSVNRQTFRPDARFNRQLRGADRGPGPRRESRCRGGRLLGLNRGGERCGDPAAVQSQGSSVICKCGVITVTSAAALESLRRGRQQEYN